MKIQNSKLAGEALALRFEPGTVVEGDADGIFEVPTKDGEFMLALPGWSAVAEKALAKAAAAPKAEKAPEVPQEAAAEAPADEESEDAPRSLWGGKKAKKKS